MAVQGYAPGKSRIRLLMPVGRCTIRKCPTPSISSACDPGPLRYPADLLLGHAVAAVLGAVQVQRGLGDVPAPGRGLFSRPLREAEPAGVELSPVVARAAWKAWKCAGSPMHSLTLGRSSEAS